jgi:hypothetical protein
VVLRDEKRLLERNHKTASRGCQPVREATLSKVEMKKAFLWVAVVLLLVALAVLPSLAYMRDPVGSFLQRKTKHHEHIKEMAQKLLKFNKKHKKYKQPKPDVVYLV